MKKVNTKRYLVLVGILLIVGEIVSTGFNSHWHTVTLGIGTGLALGLWFGSFLVE